MKYTIPKRKLDETVDCRLTVIGCEFAEQLKYSDKDDRFAEECKKAIREVGKINFETSVPGTYIFTVNLVTPDAPIRPHSFRLVGEKAHKCGVLVIEAEVESSIEIPLSFCVGSANCDPHYAALGEKNNLIFPEANFDPIWPGGLEKPDYQYVIYDSSCLKYLRLHAVAFCKCAKTPKLDSQSESESESAPEPASASVSASVGTDQSTGGSSGLASVSETEAEAEAEPLRTTETCSTNTGGQPTATTGSTQEHVQSSRVKDVSPEKLIDEIREGGHRYEAVSETVSRIMFYGSARIQVNSFAPQHSSIEGEEDLLINFSGFPPCLLRRISSIMETQFCSDASFSESSSLWFEKRQLQSIEAGFSKSLKFKIPRYTGPLTLSPMYADNNSSPSSAGAHKAASGSLSVSVDAYNCADVPVYIRLCLSEPVVQIQSETETLEMKYECNTLWGPEIFRYHAAVRSSPETASVEAEAQATQATQAAEGTHEPSAKVRRLQRQTT